VRYPGYTQYNYGQQRDKYQLRKYHWVTKNEEEKDRRLNEVMEII
jgi:hypothetical protein